MQNSKWSIGLFILTIIFCIYDVAPAWQDLNLMKATKIQLQKEIHKKNHKITKNSIGPINYLDVHQNALMDFFIKYSVANGLSIHAIDFIDQHQKNQLKSMVFKVILQGQGYTSLIRFIDQITSEKYFLNIEEIHMHFINEVNIELRLKLVITNANYVSCIKIIGV